MAERTAPRRATDTVETVAGWILAVLAIVAGALATSIGLAVHSEMDRQAELQARTRTPVAAELVDATSDSAPPGTVRPRVLAPVRWLAADGTVRQGDATVAQGQSAGAAVTIWLDQRGAPVGEPVSRSDAVLCGVVSGIAAAGLAGAALTAGWWLVRRTTLALNTRRWADEWAAVEPRWRQELR